MQAAGSEELRRLFSGFRFRIADSSDRNCWTVRASVRQCGAGSFVMVPAARRAHRGVLPRPESASSDSAAWGSFVMVRAARRAHRGVCSPGRSPRPATVRRGELRYGPRCPSRAPGGVLPRPESASSYHGRPPAIHGRLGAHPPVHATGLLHSPAPARRATAVLPASPATEPRSCVQRLSVFGSSFLRRHGERRRPKPAATA